MTVHLKTVRTVLFFNISIFTYKISWLVSRIQSISDIFLRTLLFFKSGGYDYYLDKSCVNRVLFALYDCIVSEKLPLTNYTLVPHKYSGRIVFTCLLTVHGSPLVRHLICPPGHWSDSPDISPFRHS